ncbi:MAG: NADH:flavin oxidoreductase/NADH oxidase family protein [Sphingobacteriales bacterium]|nr:MAG: NADH:flavin oxidoreductase/NADH oxidase family protein [Sphingobacteriales bacterium]
MKKQEIINQPFTLPNGVVVKNRLLKSAMSETLGTKDGAPKHDLATLYEIWANGGIGICVTGNVMIDKRALGEPNNVIIEDKSNIDALKTWAKAATSNNTQCWVQLNHPGKQSPKGLNKENVSPSAIPFKESMQTFFATPRALEENEILDIIQRFATAAEIVKEAGFSGVQIHGAHGYLVSQFLSPHHNIRTDKWGGNPENRRRFVVEVYSAMRAKVGKDFPISIKLNSADFQRGGFTEEESLDTIKTLSDLGMDLIEISGGTYEAPAMTGVKQKKSTQEREAYFIDFAEKARKICTCPLAVTGGFRSVDGMAQAISSNAVDFVGIARLLAIEPDAPNKILSGKNPEHEVTPKKTGIKAIDNMAVMEVSWYTNQLKRIGAGHRPLPNESVWVVLAKMLFNEITSKTGRFKKLRA